MKATVLPAGDGLRAFESSSGYSLLLVQQPEGVVALQAAILHFSHQVKCLLP